MTLSLVNNKVKIVDGDIHSEEITTPSAISGYGAIYYKADNLPYFQDGDGIERLLGLYGQRWSHGGDVASGEDLFLPATDNIFNITGNTEIKTVTVPATANQNMIILHFAGNPNLKYNTLSPYGIANPTVVRTMIFKPGVDFQTAADNMLVMYYNTYYGSVWFQIMRATA